MTRVFERGIPLLVSSVCTWEGCRAWRCSRWAQAMLLLLFAAAWLIGRLGSGHRRRRDGAAGLAAAAAAARPSSMIGSSMSPGGIRVSFSVVPSAFCGFRAALRAHTGLARTLPGSTPSYGEQLCSQSTQPVPWWLGTQRQALNACRALDRRLLAPAACPAQPTCTSQPRQATPSQHGAAGRRQCGAEGAADGPRPVAAQPVGGEHWR